MSISLIEQLTLVKEYQKRDKTNFNQAWVNYAVDSRIPRRRITEMSYRLQQHNKINEIDEIVKALLYFPQIDSFRQAEILVRMLKGKSNKEIADELYVTDKTVKFHKRNIFKKCGFKNTLSMVAYTLKSNILPKGG